MFDQKCLLLNDIIGRVPIIIYIVEKEECEQAFINGDELHLPVVGA